MSPDLLSLHVQVSEVLTYCSNAYALDYNESIIRVNAERLVALGLRDLGYKVIIFDDAVNFPKHTWLCGQTCEDFDTVSWS